jgi:hypothetical protein
MASTISAGTSAGTAIAIAGDTTGNLAFTTQAGTYTQTVPNATGTVMVSGNMPAFSAYLNSNTSVTTGVTTKVTFDIEEFDTNNNFASSRFTPTIAGYYQINSCVLFASASATQTSSATYIYKNGSAYKIGSDFTGVAMNSTAQTISTIVYMNGSTDYLEIYGFVTGTTNVFLGGSVYTWFSGCLVRTA